MLVRLDADLDRPTVERELDSVVDQVREHLSHLVRIREHRRQVVRGKQVDANRRRQVRAVRLDGAERTDGRVDRLERHVDAAGVEATRPEDVVHDPRQAVRFVGDDVQKPFTPVVAELHVVALQRHRRSVDGGEWRAQLVRGGRDELRAELLEPALLGQIPERVHRAVRERDAGDREPELLLADVERRRLRASGRLPGSRRHRHTIANRRPAGNRILGEPVDDGFAR